MNEFKYFLLIISFVSSCSLNAHPFFNGEKSIILLNAENEGFVIGKIKFTNESGVVNYQLGFDENVFSNEFLSMRPFKCLGQQEKMVCHLVYPYRKQGYITDNDLTDLEYDLLFLFKTPEEYGINAWNGLYYLMTLSNEGISGKLHEVDLNVLAAPPEEGDLRPVTKDMLYEADPNNHLFPELIIK